MPVEGAACSRVRSGYNPDQTTGAQMNSTFQAGRCFDREQGRSIYRAIAATFAEAGANMVPADRDLAPLQDFTAGSVWRVKDRRMAMDAADSASAEAMVSAAVDAFGSDRFHRPGWHLPCRTLCRVIDDQRRRTL